MDDTLPPCSLLGPVRPELSPEEVRILRVGLMQRLPRFSVRELDSFDRLLHAVEDIAMELGDELTARREKRDPYWWQTQDLLDDVLDVHAAVSRLKEQGTLTAPVGPAAPPATG